MADTVYESPTISFTRFWRDGEDWVQITIIPVEMDFHAYQVLSFKEFEKAYLALKANVEETKEAWWHELSKAKQAEVK